MTQIVSTDLRHSVYRRDDWTCIYCGSTENLSIDHIVPKAAGGSNYHTNLVCACLTCNRAKSDTPVGIWLRSVCDTAADARWVLRQVRNARARVLHRGLETVLASCAHMGRLAPRSYLAARALLSAPAAA